MTESVILLRYTNAIAYRNMVANVMNDVFPKCLVHARYDRVCYVCVRLYLWYMEER